jgi:hypothetical protein
MHRSYRIEKYLEDVGRCRNNSFGQRFRTQFRDTRGSAELAMLASPSEQEYRDFCQAVKVMDESEKADAGILSDEQIADIADRAQADQGNVNIFLNGFALELKNKTLKQSK